MAQKSKKQVYQFKITLEEVMPTVWRRIRVSENFTFWDLHVAIQNAMGWQDCHLHEWLCYDSENNEEVHLGIYPNEFEGQPEVIMDWEVPIKKYFLEKGTAIPYTYDFGDGWKHVVELEDILQADSEETYPLCLAGENACPPEDVGGPLGYADFVKAMDYKNHVDHQQMQEWHGKEFDSRHFEPGEVAFQNPKKRLDNMLNAGMM